MARDPRRLAVIGWSLVILVAVLMLAIRGREEAGPAIVFAIAAVAVGAWVWARASRASLIVSLALGALWLLQFAAYTIADVVGDDFDAAIFVTDVIGVVAGIVIAVASIRGLRARGRGVAAAPS